MNRRRALIQKAFCLLFFVALLATSFASFGGSAHADDWNGRGEFQGYFSGVTIQTSRPYRTGCPWTARGNNNCNGTDNGQNFILPQDTYKCGNNGGDALPLNCVNTWQDLYNLLYYYNTTAGNDSREVSSSAFIVQTMLGRTGDDAGNNGGRNISNADWAQLKEDLQGEANAGQITGLQRSVRYSSTTRTFAAFINGTNKGDAVHYSDPSDPQNDPAIIFYNAAGQVRYVLFRPCANPGGSLKGLPSFAATKPYNLQPSVNADISGNADVAEPGDTITFTYEVDNNGSGDSAPATCTLYSKSFAGYHATPGGAPYDTSGAQSKLCNNKVFNNNDTTTVGTETYNVTAADENTTICRTLSVNPATGPPPTGTHTDEACVPVANQPYFRIFGGDISAGNAQPSTTCNPGVDDYNAAIVSWNSAKGLYNGGGTQFAAFAVDDIDHFASSQTNVATSRGVAPSGLSFANTTAGAGGLYGGDLGTGALPCMSDYYDVPAGAQNLSNNTVDVGTLASGAYIYTGAGTLTLHGTLASGATPSRIQIFVKNQNVYVSSNITYQGNWQSFAQIPMFELVVKSASIYVSNNVGELDGTYVAEDSQADGQGTGGQIATCGTAAGPAALDDSLYTACNNQLIVDGAFVADDVLMERSVNTLSDSPADSPSALTSSAAEQFNYNPSLWVVQPPTPPGALTYNTIVDLPPVL